MGTGDHMGGYGPLSVDEDESVCVLTSIVIDEFDEDEPEVCVREDISTVALPLFVRISL